MMGLADLAVAVVHPLLKEKLCSWDPLKVFFYGGLLLKKPHALFVLNNNNRAVILGLF